MFISDMHMHERQVEQASIVVKEKPEHPRDLGSTSSAPQAPLRPQSSVRSPQPKHIGLSIVRSRAQSTVRAVVIAQLGINAFACLLSPVGWHDWSRFLACLHRVCEYWRVERYEDQLVVVLLENLAT